MNSDFQNKFGYPEFDPFQDENCFRYMAEHRAELENWDYEKVMVTDLLPGDTVKVNGELQTVCSSNLKYSSFMGWTFKGNAYPTGIIKATSKAEAARHHRK